MLKNDNGDKVGWGSRLEETTMDYFSNLFAATIIECNEVIKYVSSLVIEEQNTAMVTEFQSKEIKKSMFKLHLDKSPRLDEMSNILSEVLEGGRRRHSTIDWSFLFYREFWSRYNRHGYCTDSKEERSIKVVSKAYFFMQYCVQGSLEGVDK